MHVFCDRYYILKCQLPVRYLKNLKPAFDLNYPNFLRPVLIAEGTFEAIVLHEGGLVVDANNQYYEMVGYNPAELAGMDAISLTATPESVVNIREQISLGNLGPYEITGVKKDGTKFPMESRIKLIEYKGRKVRLAAIRDLSERMKWEAALKKRTKELELKTQQNS